MVSWGILASVRNWRFLFPKKLHDFEILVAILVKFLLKPTL